MIQIRKFEKYYGRIYAAGPLDLDIGRGETFALLGPNGGGKSTVIRALVGLHAPTRGSVAIDGTDLSKRRQRDPPLVSYLPQRLTVPDKLTGREIVSLITALRGAPKVQAERALQEMELAGHAGRFVGEYSGGMLQRLGLAITFLGSPQILVMDEPTLNLDSLGREMFRDRILQLKKEGVTIVFSSHILQDAEYLADRVGVLVEGKLVAVRSIPEFRERVSLETSVRVILQDMDDVVREAAAIAGATNLDWVGSSLQFTAPPERRLEIIRAIEEAGGEIKEFHSDPPNWEALIGRR